MNLERRRAGSGPRAQPLENHPLVLGVEGEDLAAMWALGFERHPFAFSYGKAINRSPWLSSNRFPDPFSNLIRLVIRYATRR